MTEATRAPVKIDEWMAKYTLTVIHEVESAIRFQDELIIQLKPGLSSMSHRELIGVPKEISGNVTEGIFLRYEIAPDDAQV